MSPAEPRTRLFLWVPRTLADELRQAADREANTPSAVARRLIATGIARERRCDTAGRPVKAEPEER